MINIGRVGRDRGSCSRKVIRVENSIVGPSCSVYALHHPYRSQCLKGHEGDSTHYPHPIGPLKNAHAIDQESDVVTDK